MKRVPTTAKNIEYILKHLANGRSLSRLVLNTQKFSEGFVYVSVDADDDDELDDFENGVGETLIGSSSRVETFILNALTHRTVLFEHPLANRSDPWLTERKNTTHFAFHNDEVMYKLSEEDMSNAQDTSDLIYEATGHECTGFVCTGNLPPNIEFSKQVLQYLADRVVAVILSAFDGDGFVVWTKDEQLV